MSVVIVVIVALETATVATIACNRTKKKNSSKSQNRQSVHNPVLIVVIISNIILVCRTKAVRGNRTTAVAAGFLNHTHANGRSLPWCVSL